MCPPNPAPVEHAGSHASEGKITRDPYLVWILSERLGPVRAIIQSLLKRNSYKWLSLPKSDSLRP